MRFTNLVPRHANGVPFRQMNAPLFALQQGIDRRFKNSVRVSDGLSRWRAVRPGAIKPRINIAESDTAIEVTAELPGVAMEDIDVSLSHDLLTIKGEKRYESQEVGQGYRRIECRYGSFCRTIPVPADLINASRLEVSFKNGILAVILPKRGEVQPERV